MILERRCSVLALSMWLCSSVFLIGSPAQAVPITNLHDEFTESKSHDNRVGATTRRSRWGSTLPAAAPLGSACTDTPASAESVQTSPRVRGRGASVGAATKGGTGTGTRSRPRRGSAPPPPTVTPLVTPCLDPALDTDGESSPFLDPIEPDPIDVLVEEFTNSDQSTPFDLPTEVLSQSDGVELLSLDFSFTDSIADTPPLDREDRQSIPEPGTLATLGAGLLAITWMVRRRQPIRLKLRPDR